MTERERYEAQLHLLKEIHAATEAALIRIHSSLAQRAAYAAASTRNDKRVDVQDSRAVTLRRLRPCIGSLERVP